MDRDTLFYLMLTPLVVAKWFEHKNTETIHLELSAECGGQVEFTHGDIANALGRWRDAQATVRAA